MLPTKPIVVVKLKLTSQVQFAEPQGFFHLLALIVHKLIPETSFESALHFSRSMLGSGSAGTRFSRSRPGSGSE